MAEEVYLNQKVDTSSNRPKTCSSRMSSESYGSQDSSYASMSDDQNRLLRVVQRKHSTVHSVSISIFYIAAVFEDNISIVIQSSVL